MKFSRCPHEKKALPRGKAFSVAPANGAGSGLDFELFGND
jgi:hypothetical protein